MLGYIVIEERDGERRILTKTETIEEAVECCLDDAEDNGVIPALESREELRERLMVDQEYTDGDVTVSIIRDDS